MHDSAAPAFSEYGALCTVAAPVQRLIALFSSEFRAGTDANLAVGYINEETLPVRELQSALEVVLTNPDRHPNALNYGGASGSPNLVRSLSSFLARNAVGGLHPGLLDARRMIIGVSGATSILEAFALLLPRGVVVTSDPYYYIYAETLERYGFRIIAIPEDEYGIQTALIEGAVANCVDELRFIYVSTVGNPTSTILSSERRRELVSIGQSLSARAKRPIPVVFDTAYEALIHDPSLSPPDSGFAFDRSNLVYEVGSLSKVLAPALRLGYLLGPDTALLRALLQRTTDIGFSAPLLNQEMASVLLDHHGDDLLRNLRGNYRAKAQKTRALLESGLGPEIAEIRGGRAGFYYYVTLRNVVTSEGSAFYRLCSRTTGRAEVDRLPDGTRKPRVSFLPGAFCTHPQGSLRQKAQHQLRISYGFETLAGIERGIAVMREACQYALGQS